MVILIILSLAIVTVADEKGVYCDVYQNEYYVKQWGQCKPCDRCPEGYGLDSKSSVDRDPLHGALGCRRCLKCDAGKTFNSKIGYGECEKCTNCSAEGKKVASPCTVIADTVCSKTVIQESVAVQSYQNERESVSSDTHHGKNVQHEGFHLVSLAGIAVLLVLVPVLVVVIFKNKEKFYCWKGDPSTTNDVEEQVTCSLKRKDLDGPPTTLETEVESVPLKTMEPSMELAQDPMRPQSVVSEDLPPLASNFRYSLESNLNLREDELEMDAGMITDRQFSEVPTDKELQRVCLGIAYNNYHVRLGRELGVEDNEIQRIKEEQINDIRETAFQILKKWREINGNSATKYTLQQALKKIGLSNVCASLNDDP